MAVQQKTGRSNLRQAPQVEQPEEEFAPQPRTRSRFGRTNGGNRRRSTGCSAVAHALRTHIRYLVAEDADAAALYEDAKIFVLTPDRDQRVVTPIVVMAIKVPDHTGRDRAFVSAGISAPENGSWPIIYSQSSTENGGRGRDIELPGSCADLIDDELQAAVDEFVRSTYGSELQASAEVHLTNIFELPRLDIKTVPGSDEVALTDQLAAFLATAFLDPLTSCEAYDSGDSPESLRDIGLDRRLQVTPVATGGDSLRDMCNTVIPVDIRLELATTAQSSRGRGDRGLRRERGTGENLIAGNYMLDFIHAQMDEDDALDFARKHRLRDRDPDRLPQFVPVAILTGVDTVTPSRELMLAATVMSAELGTGDQILRLMARDQNKTQGGMRLDIAAVSTITAMLNDGVPDVRPLDITSSSDRTELVSRMVYPGSPLVGVLVNRASPSYWLTRMFEAASETGGNDELVEHLDNLAGRGWLDENPRMRELIEEGPLTELFGNFVIEGTYRDHNSEEQPLSGITAMMIANFADGDGRLLQRYYDTFDLSRDEASCLLERLEVFEKVLNQEVNYTGISRLYVLGNRCLEVVSAAFINGLKGKLIMGSVTPGAYRERTGDGRSGAVSGLRPTGISLSGHGRRSGGSRLGSR